METKTGVSVIESTGKQSSRGVLIVNVLKLAMNDSAVSDDAADDDEDDIVDGSEWKDASDDEFSGAIGADRYAG